MNTTYLELLTLGECIILKFNIQNKTGYIISLYRLPSQTHNEFEDFFLNFEQVLYDFVIRNQFFCSHNRRSQC